MDTFLNSSFSSAIELFKINISNISIKSFGNTSSILHKDFKNKLKGRVNWKHYIIRTAWSDWFRNIKIFHLNLFRTWRGKQKIKKILKIFIRALNILFVKFLAWKYIDSSNFWKIYSCQKAFRASFKHSA